MKIIVVGGTGHIGRFLVPKLVAAGFETLVVASGRTPVPDNEIWSKVKYIKCAVTQASELTQLVDEAPEVVIEIPGSAGAIYESMKPVAKHVIACGSIWMFGEPKVVPTPDQTQNECPFEGYAERYAKILQLVDRGRKDGIAFTAIMPPNICGPGKIPLECLGGRSLDVHKDHARGKEVILPDGPDALVGPCDAEDIADCFLKAVLNRDESAYQLFNVAPDYSLTATEFVAAYASIYNVEIPIKRVSWHEYSTKVSPGIGHWWHFKAHMCPDISKAKYRLGYQPQYTPEQTMARAVEWMRDQNII